MKTELNQKPLLDMWQAPDGAGEPVGLLATTFVIEPDFFERNCLARFLAVQSVDENTGSIEDVVAQVELEEKLAAPTVTVLADRSAQAERSSLRWNLLHCHVDTGLLHSKVSILLWKDATRIIIGSANLTPAGYRYNLELAIAADLGDTCVLSKTVLEYIVDEVESYLDLVPGLSPAIPARRQTQELIALLRERVAAQPTSRARLQVSLAPTNTTTSPLDRLPDVWKGGNPLSATHLSPYWDSLDAGALNTVSALLTGRPAADRRHEVAVTIGPTGDIPFPEQRANDVDGVYELGGIDKDVARVLHAKCLLIRNSEWVAALIGSSNHTAAGLGLGGARRHREINVWFGAPAGTKEGKALNALIPKGQAIAPQAKFENPVDEDEPEETLALPTFFTLCRVSKAPEGWEMRLGFGEGGPLHWSVHLPQGNLITDNAQWEATGRQVEVIYAVEPDNIPSYLTVKFPDGEASWVVLADDRHELPPGPRLADIRADQLLDALAQGKSLSQVVREELEQDAARRVAGGGVLIDPLKRFDSQSTLLRRGRALGNALSALERRLGRQVVTIEALEARLKGPLGPTYLATRLADDRKAGLIGRAEAIFTLAEIALSVSRVDWSVTLQHVDQAEGRSAVSDSLDTLDTLRVRLGSEPRDIADYSIRALREAKRCLSI
ncbi:hypothetical protein [Gordonia rhizosphera]|uniref:PLD phosphodiesterase domain-containing protein n=1 Tax=Gordonia rhizosphera NBRC 16068 TaxID=1108045 RepID=K6WKP6_9ACTN|nr:hypothetical protein [Gordonia rhizosphera]GAB92722.1 hypothetical protein GORHZ_188_00140 [Gordonia rhizosphera NBRC 16068]